MIEYLDSILVTPCLRDNRDNHIVQHERMDSALINLSMINIMNDATGVFFIACQLPIVAIYYHGATAPVHYQDDYQRVMLELKKWKLIQEKNRLSSKFN